MTLVDGVKVIADFAFYGNKNLVSVKLSNGVNIVGTYAFYDCNNLSTVEVPASVKNIGDWAFAASEKLTVYVQADSFAENYAKENEVKYDYMGITLKDATSGVIVITDNKNILPLNSQLDVSVSKVDEGSLYDISVNSEGESVSPDGFVTVKILAPKGMDASACKVYQTTGDDYTYVNVIHENGYLVFKTDKLGQFLVTTQLLTAIPGDANGDGKITAIDARIVLQISAGTRVATDEEVAKIDITGDGKITAIDARRILQIAAGV